MISTTSSLFIFSRNAISMSTESEVLPLVMIQSVNKARLGFRSSRNSSIWDSLWPVTKWHTMIFPDKYVINKDITKPCSSLMPTYNKKIWLSFKNSYSSILLHIILGPCIDNQNNNDLELYSLTFDWETFDPVLTHELGQGQPILVFLPRTQ